MAPLRSKRNVLLAFTALASLGVAALSSGGHGHRGRPIPAIDWQREFTSFDHADGGIEHRVLVRGEGPPVLLLQELPGVTNDVLDLALRLSAERYSVYLPILFGTPGERAPGRNLFRSCGSREFTCLSGRTMGPVVDWLRSLSRRIHGRHPGERMAAIGMCLTGPIPLELARDPWVAAPVVSQPAVPLIFGKDQLAASDAAFEAVGTRDVDVLAFRFSRDRLAPPERLGALCSRLRGRVRAYEIPSGADSDGSAWPLSKDAHAVLSSEYVPTPGHPTARAFEILLSFLDEKLRGGPALPPPGACPAELGSMPQTSGAPPPG